jgi:hypothetical protein
MMLALSARELIQFRFLERDRAVIVQATKFLLPFLVVGGGKMLNIR